MVWRILVVEDEQDSGEITHTMVTMAGGEASVVTTAEAALYELGINTYDAVLIDLMLPGMNGLDLLRTIRQTPVLAHLPCVAITAYGAGNLRRQALDAGCNLYYAKPLDPADLMHGIQKLLGNS